MSPSKTRENDKKSSPASSKQSSQESSQELGTTITKHTKASKPKIYNKCNCNWGDDKCRLGMGKCSSISGTRSCLENQWLSISVTTRKI